MGGSRALAQGWPLIAGQLTASAPVAPILGALSISPNTGTIGQAYSGTISGATPNSFITLDNLTVSGTGTTRSVTGTLSGSPGAWPATETLAGATGSPRMTPGVLTVSAAGAVSTTADSTAVTADSTAYTADRAA